jgi:transcriptional regulator with XRE-family HTH domain
VRTLRRALGLTQEEFAARYHIPLGTLRDWEQGRSQPDQPARAFLAVIARAPNEIAALLLKYRHDYKTPPHPGEIIRDLCLKPLGQKDPDKV